MNVPLKSMTADDFAAWSMTQERARFELIDGMIVQMNAERVGHARAKRSADRALQAALDASGLTGEVFRDGVAVKISDRIVHEPDALLRLGSPLPEDDVLILDPVVVVEVLSPSTGPVDLTTKLVNYFSVETVKDYLIVDTVKKLVLHYARASSGQPTLTGPIQRGQITLSAGLTLAYKDFFGFDGLTK